MDGTKYLTGVIVPLSVITSVACSCLWSTTEAAIVVCAGLFVSLVLFWRLSRSDRHVVNGVDVTCSVLFLVAALSQAYSVYAPNGTSPLLLLGIGLGVYWIQRITCRALSVESLCLALSLLALYVAAEIISRNTRVIGVARAQGFEQISSLRYLLQSPFPSFVLGETVIVLILLLPIPFACLACGALSRTKTAFYGCIASLIVYSMLLSFLRAVYLSLAVFIVVVAIQVRKVTPPCRNYFVRLSAPIILPICVIAVLYPRPLTDTIRLNATLSQQRSTAGRIRIWRATVEMLSEHQWIGRGPGNFALLHQANGGHTDGGVFTSRPFNLALDYGISYGVPSMLIAAFVSLWLFSSQTKSSGGYYLLNLRCNLRRMFGASVMACLAHETFYSSLLISVPSTILWSVTLAYLASRESSAPVYNRSGGDVPPWKSPIAATLGHACPILAFISIVVLVWQSKQQSIAKSYYTAATRELAMGDYEQAQELMRNAIRQSPNDSYYHAIYGLSIEKANSADRWNGSSDSLVRPVKDESRTIRQRARLEYIRSLQSGLPDPSVLNNLALLSARDGDLGTGLSFSKRALAVQPQDPEFLVTGSVIADRAGLPTLAREMEEKAIEYSPRLLYSQWFEGLMLLCSECQRVVIQHVRQDLEASERESPSIITEARLGAVLGALGHDDEAIRILRRVVDQLPGLSEAWCHLGRSYERKGDTSAALRAYKTSLISDPDSVDARLDLCNLEARAIGANSTCMDDLEWRFRVGLRSQSSLRAAHLFAAAPPIGDDIVLDGFLSFCCFQRADLPLDPIGDEASGQEATSR